MALRYDRTTDRYVGHGTGLGGGWPHFLLDEIELGARAALCLDDPEQWWWELIGREALEEEYVMTHGSYVLATTDTDLIAWLTGPLTHALGGQAVAERTDDGVLITRLDVLRTLGEGEDGSITDGATGPVMWVEGDPYPLAPATAMTVATVTTTTTTYGADFGQQVQADSILAYINGGDYREDQATQIFEALFRAFRAEVDERLPEGVSWQPSTSAFVHPVDVEMPEHEAMTEVFTAAWQAVEARWPEDIEGLTPA